MRVADFMGAPVSPVAILDDARSNSLFVRDLDAPDRDAFIRLNAAFMGTYPLLRHVLW